MNDKKKDFIAAILAIVIILLIILIILVSYVLINVNNKEKNQDVDVYSVNSSFDKYDGVTTKDVISKIDDSKEYVYEAKYNYELNFDNVKFDINSIMPIININNEDINLINSEIKDYYNSIKEKEELYELSYTTYNYNDILSIVIQKTQKRTDNIKNVSNVLIYNINTKTGSVVQNRDIIDMKKTSVDKICIELMNTISKDLKKDYNFDISNSSFLIDNKKTSEDYIKEKIYIEKDENLGNNFKMYLNNKGNICISFFVPILNTNEKYTYSNFILNI